MALQEQQKNGGEDMKVSKDTRNTTSYSLLLVNEKCQILLSRTKPLWDTTQRLCDMALYFQDDLRFYNI